MLLLISTSLALLVTYAGVKLLMQVQKDELNNLYKYVSWFFIITGLFTLLITLCFFMIKVKNQGEIIMKENFKNHGIGINNNELDACMKIYGCEIKHAKCCIKAMTLNNNCCESRIKNNDNKPNYYYKYNDHKFNYWMDWNNDKSQKCNRNNMDGCKKDSIKNKD